MNYIIPFLILITIVVFIHEYGHYYFAKKYGVGITDFSIGFGREIFGWSDKSGTRWKICWIPLGGYVKFFGDRNVFSETEQQEVINKYNEEDRKKLFILKPIYQRSIIVAAGPLANFVLAILIFIIINMVAGKDMTPAVINEVQEDSPACVAGMKKNDKIEKNERIEMLKLTIWFNLFIGIYNLYVFNEMNSLFHLVLGSVNIAVWVFFRERYLNFSFASLFNASKKDQSSI